jgi:hypothetical protein
MSLIQSLVIGVLILTAMTACAPIKHHNNQPIHRIQAKLSQKVSSKLSEISMTFLGGSMQFPIHTTIRLANYAAPTISYSKKLVVSADRVVELKKALGDNVFQKIEKSWQADLRTQDFVDIDNTCKKLNIWTQASIDWPADAKKLPQCANSSDIQFYVRSQTGQENRFLISGKMLCQQKFLPAGLTKLMAELTALIPKYQPDSKTQLAFL